MNIDQLTQLISKIVIETLAINNTAESIRPSPFDAPDVSIRPEYSNRISELDKVPDIVKGLREFNGNPAEFSSWKKSVDRIMEIYTGQEGSPRYFGILHTIRNKITGLADTALESYSVPLDWSAITKCLTLNYADKRDITALEYQMTGLTQGNQSVEEFHSVVYKHLSLILIKVGCMNVTRESERLLTKVYRDKALDTFVRGFQGDLPRLLGIKEPTDLPQALHLCLKLKNQKYVASQAN